MKTLIDAGNLIWLWKDVPIKIKDLSNKKLKFIKFMLIQQAAKNNIFWNGIHYTGYIEAIEQILNNKVIVQNEPIDSKSENIQLEETVRFLGKLNETFPKSGLLRQTQKQTKEQLKLQLQELV